MISLRGDEKQPKVRLEDNFRAANHHKVMK